MAKKSMKIKAHATPKYSTRAYTRCERCGRPHSVLRKYKLCESHKEMRQRMYYLVQKRLDEIGKAGERVAIRCAGWHTYFLLREFSELLEVDYLINSNPKFKNSKLMYDELKQERVVKTI